MVSVFIITAVTLIAYIIIKSWSWLCSRYRIYSALSKAPGPKPHWFLGNASDLGDNLVKGLLKLDSQYPRKFALYYGIWTPVLAINHPETVKMALKHHYNKDTFSSKCVRDWTGDGILVSNGSRWARNRRLLTPAFHFQILQSYVSVYNDCVEILINKWKHKCDKSIEIFDDMSLMTFDVLLRCALSSDLEIQTSDNRHPFLVATEENTSVIEERFINPLYYFTTLFKLTSIGKKFFKNVDYSIKFAKEIVTARRKQLKIDQADISNKKYLDFLDMMLQAKDSSGNGLTDDEMVAEAITFLFAGHDTTATNISFTLFSLAQHPEYQQKIREEYRKVLNGKEQLSWKDLSELKFTTMCIKEALRMHTTVALPTRRLTVDTEIDGQIFPKDLEVEIQSYLIHHNPDVWPDPWTFDPMRFTPEKIEKRDPYAFIPFATGARNCIGQNFAMTEMKLAVARLVDRFELSVAEGHPLDHVIAAVLHNTGGTWIQLKDREA